MRMNRERQIMALTALVVVIGGIALAFTDRTLPDALIALGSMALGGLRGGQPDVQAVSGVDGGPVPVDPSPPPTPRRRRRATPTTQED